MAESYIKNLKKQLPCAVHFAQQIFAEPHRSLVFSLRLPPQELRATADFWLSLALSLAEDLALT